MVIVSFEIGIELPFYLFPLLGSIAVRAFNAAHFISPQFNILNNIFVLCYSLSLTDSSPFTRTASLMLFACASIKYVSSGVASPKTVSTSFIRLGFSTAEIESSKSSSMEALSAFAIFTNAGSDTFAAPVSIPEQCCGLISANSANRSCVIPCFLRMARIRCPTNL